MSGYIYAGESDGGRIIRYGGSDTTQITTSGTESVLPYLATWDIQPLGPSGDCVFRSVIVTVLYGNGFAISVTPYVDDVALSTQTFSGAGSGKQDCQAWVKARGSRCHVHVEATSRTGSLKFEVTDCFFVGMRRVP